MELELQQLCWALVSYCNVPLFSQDNGPICMGTLSGHRRPQGDPSVSVREHLAKRLRPSPECLASYWSGVAGWAGPHHDFLWTCGVWCRVHAVRSGRVPVHVRWRVCVHWWGGGSPAASWGSMCAFPVGKERPVLLKDRGNSQTSVPQCLLTWNADFWVRVSSQLITNRNFWSPKSSRPKVPKSVNHCDWVSEIFWNSCLFILATWNVFFFTSG